MYNVSIPQISKEEVIKRYKKVKPIVTINNTKYWLRDFNENELTQISFLDNIINNKANVVDCNDLVQIPGTDFDCIHKYEYPGIFQANVAEILAQIPKAIIDYVDAFEIIDMPRTLSDVYKNKMIFDNGFHMSKVRLYVSRKTPNVVFSDDLVFYT